MITKPIPYGHQNITQEDVDVVIAALKSDYMTQGPLICLHGKQRHCRFAPLRYGS